MRCLECGRFSLKHICSYCQDTFLKPSLYKRELDGTLQVFSFYRYEDIKKYIHTKHTDLGYYLYNILAHNSFKKFAENFIYTESIASLSIDDEPNQLYSHTAILNKHLKSEVIKPQYQKLIAQNKVSYSGKSKAFRLAHKRNFSFGKFTHKSCIIVDDIITTGTTLKEAVEICQKNAKEVLFCLTLADAR